MPPFTSLAENIMKIAYILNIIAIDLQAKIAKIYFIKENVKFNNENNSIKIEF